MKECRFKRLIFFIIFGALIARLIFAFLTPPLEIADGIAHFGYISYIAEERKLPVMEGPGTEFYQPPLYYIILGALLYIGKSVANEFPIIILSMANIIFGIAAVYVAYRIGLLLFKNKFIIGGIVTFVALLPTFSNFNSHITNVNLEVLITTIGIYLLLLVLKEDKKENYKLLILAGAVLGLAVITRLSAVSLATASVFLLLLKCYSNRRLDYLSFLKSISMLLIPLLAVSGWWFIRNFMLYGDFLGENAVKLVTAGKDYAWTASLVIGFFGRIFATFWAGFGISNNDFIALDDIHSLELGLSSTKGIASFAFVYGILLIITLLSVCGMLILIWQNKKRGVINNFQKKSFLFMGLHILLILASLIRFSSYDYQPQGKFFLQAIVPLAVFFTLGNYTLLSAYPKIFNKRSILAALIVLFVALNIMSMTKLLSIESYIPYVDKISRGFKEVNKNEVEILGRDGFSPAKIRVSAGSAVAFLNKDKGIPGIKKSNPDNILVIFKDDYKYLATKVVRHGEKFYYKFDKAGVYRVRNVNYGVSQIIVNVY